MNKAPHVTDILYMYVMRFDIKDEAMVDAFVYVE